MRRIGAVVRPWLPRLAMAAMVAVTGARSAAAQRVVLSAVTDDGAVIDLGAARMPARAGNANAQLLAALRWRVMRPGIDLSELDMRAGTLRTSVHAVLVRVDPAAVRFRLELRAESNRMTGTWTIDSAPDEAALAMNAGQFRETGPWGWLVLDGVELRDPIRAPLGVSIRIDSGGRLAWVQSVDRVARRDGATAFAFQSFPLLMFGRRVPAALRDPALIDMAHRDARLVLAESDDGRLLFILTRFGALGHFGARLPIGLTTPESLILAIALGAHHAVMLDGGISAQALVRDSAGGVRRWPGLRKVPLGLVAEPQRGH